MTKKFIGEVAERIVTDWLIANPYNSVQIYERKRLKNRIVEYIYLAQGGPQKAEAGDG